MAEEEFQNSPPILVLKTTPRAQDAVPYPVISGVAPLTVKFNLCESSDPEQNLEDPEAGDTLNHQFHFGDDGTEPFDEDGSFNPDFDHFCRTEHTYEEAGSYLATVSVTDKHLEDQSREVSAQARVTRQVAIEVGGSAGPPATSFAFCRSGVGIPIPDLAAVSDSQAISSARTISDLDVRVAARHTWIGDLIFTLRHVDTGTAVTLVNRPGPAGLGCNDNDIAVVLDDAAGAGVDGACPNTEATPGLSGTFAPSAPLAAFNGETLDGTWQITARDDASGDTGTLDEWCLLAFAP
jgi:hypothetical protein